ncbi:MAG: hypothetical protein AAF660_01830 [Pseudomonadota bacterium]
MTYHCPQPADMADVSALNHAFLCDLRDRQHRALDDLAGDGHQALRQLADVPFLIYRLHAPDPGFWQRTFAGANDLVDAAETSPARETGQVASTLGFLWHLSRRDAHAARLFTGSSGEWCRQLAETPLVHLINRSLACGLRPALRLDADDPRWRAMVWSASGGNKADRLVAVMRVFQALLIAGEQAARHSAAACRSRSPARQFAVRERR